MDQVRKLRTGWTTGACATAAAKAAATGLLTGAVPSEVPITLPRGERPVFAVEESSVGDGRAVAAVRKDAGDDPDVTHRALIRVEVARAAGAAVVFRAGEGVGTVTRPGLPVPPGEPAINPVPRRMIEAALAEVSAAHGPAHGPARRAGQGSGPWPEDAAPLGFEVTVSVPGGAELARRTWNGRLGIEGGISILGTTGIVRPFSCAAWIASIHRGVDVARASGLPHVIGATGSTSEAAVRELYDLPEVACLDMGDFAGGLLKYLARHPVPRVTIAGGIGKMAKLAQGAMDLHSGRSQVDFGRLARLAARAGADPAPVAAAGTALEALALAGPGLAQAVAEEALAAVRRTLGAAPVTAEAIVVDREGRIVGRAA